MSEKLFVYLGGSPDERNTSLQLGLIRHATPEEIEQVVIKRGREINELDESYKLRLVLQVREYPESDWEDVGITPEDLEEEDGH